MLYKCLILSLLCVFIILGGHAVYSAHANIDGMSVNKPIVVELFTSQSCSSCPAADKVLKELSKNPNIIPIAYHVTYWNHLSWEDTLSQDFATHRQRNYSKHRRSNRVYTPQMIVNGVDEFVGSNRLKARKAIAAAKPVVSIDLQRLSDNELQISLPSVDKGKYVVWLAGTKASHTENIKRGENRGRIVDYTHAAQTLDIVQQWDGSTITITTDINMNDVVDTYTVFVQENAYGRIIAAGRL